MGETVPCCIGRLCTAAACGFRTKKENEYVWKVCRNFSLSYFLLNRPFAMLGKKILAGLEKKRGKLDFLQNTKGIIGKIEFFKGMRQESAVFLRDLHIFFFFCLHFR